MDQQNQNLFELQLDQPSAAYLGEAAKWAKFLAIIGFIFCGLMILAALFMGQTAIVCCKLDDKTLVEINKNNVADM